MLGSNKNESEKRKSEKNKIDEKREHERKEKKEKSGDKKNSETIKKDENQERKMQTLFMRKKEVKRVMLARQPMYLLMLHDYCLSSIASSFSLGV